LEVEAVEAAVEALVDILTDRYKKDVLKQTPIFV
jgi:diacylglycerol kinase